MANVKELAESLEAVGDLDRPIVVYDALSGRTDWGLGYEDVYQNQYGYEEDEEMEASLFRSYRGYYDEPELVRGDGEVFAKDLLGALKAIPGSTRTGYKGGEYTYDKWSDLWYGDYGTCCGYRVIGFRDADDHIAMVIAQVGD